MYGRIHTIYSTYTVDWPVQRPSVLENQLPEKGKSANERLNRKHVRVLHTNTHILHTNTHTLHTNTHTNSKDPDLVRFMSQQACTQYPLVRGVPQMRNSMENRTA